MFGIEITQLHIISGVYVAVFIVMAILLWRESKQKRNALADRAELELAVTMAKMGLECSHSILTDMRDKQFEQSQKLKDLQHTISDMDEEIQVSAELIQEMEDYIKKLEKKAKVKKADLFCNRNND